MLEVSNPMNSGFNYGNIIDITKVSVGVATLVVGGTASNMVTQVSIDGDL